MRASPLNWALASCRNEDNHLNKKIYEPIGAISNFLASLSIIAAASLFIFDFVESRISDVQATITNSTNRGVTLFLTNTGGKDIVILSASIVVPDYEIKNSIDFGKNDVLIKVGETLVKPSNESDLQSTVLIESVVGDISPQNSHIHVGRTKCMLEVDFVNVEGKKFKKSFAHTCFAGSVGYGGLSG